MFPAIIVLSALNTSLMPGVARLHLRPFLSMALWPSKSSSGQAIALILLISVVETASKQVIAWGQVVGSDGTLAVMLLPRYIVHNALRMRLAYRQQDAALERVLERDGARAVHWPLPHRPLRLCLRVQEAGWRWSGGLALDTPGNLFAKIRHRCGLKAIHHFCS